MSRDKIINELRLRMPASSNRDDILRDVLKSDPHLQHSTKVAQQLNDNLKVASGRLCTKYSVVALYVFYLSSGLLSESAASEEC